MSFNELMQICFSHGLDGRDTDTCVKGIAVNALKPDKPVVSIEMKSPSDLLRMMKCADDTHIFIDGSFFYINALYAVAGNFPATRIYFMKTRDFMAMPVIAQYLQASGIKLPPINGESLVKLIDEQNYADRYQTWHVRWKSNMKPFDGLVDGRIKNTAVEKGMWLSSDGRCLICGAKTDLMSTATLIGKTGLVVGFQLCQIHEAEAKNHSTLLNYVAEKMGIPPPLLTGGMVVRHEETTVKMTCDAVRSQLNCAIEKVEKQTVTAVRKSGFRIILRQDSLTDYAYNIQDPNENPISRIDSADHHVVEYGPDHVHRDLGKEKKKKKKNEKIVESSFTYGFAVADIKAIRNLVEEAEASWIKQASS